jgi:outer membrane lipoprotein-sorting protein
LFGLAARGSAIEPELRDLLTRMAGAFDGRGTVRGTFEQDVELALMGEIRHYSGQVWYHHPDRLRLEYEEPTGQLLVCDGTEFWMVLTDQGRPQIFRVPIAEEIGGFLSHRTLEILAKRYRSRVDGEEIIAGSACLRIVFEVEKDDLTARFQNLVLWVNRDDLYSRRLTYDDAAGNRITYRFHGWRPIVTVPDSLFSYTPPLDADRFDHLLGPEPTARED